MSTWFGRWIVETGRLPLFCFFAGTVLGFTFIRLSVRLIRAQVRWWPGNVIRGDVHVHHVVFGVVFMWLGGVAGLAIPGEEVGWRAGVAAVFGVGSALVLDEFALILHLKDVYWAEQGRLSVDMMFVALSVTGMLLLGLRPALIDDLTGSAEDGSPQAVLITWTAVLIDLAIVVITLLKGKIWTGLFGLFVPIPLLVVGAIRLARPGSPWARWRYKPDRPRGLRKLARARWREQRLRQPVARAKVWVQELVSGRHDAVPRD
ncbi:hypothetical protein [Solihabitans fulvus]|uniref:hypothetical protein n=1 Tax=Solihabitans fulvus TaxID=1892852 RepID=UPI001CB76510|nr:hypothetical protein [Solihabitans fulvus]